MFVVTATVQVAQSASYGNVNNKWEMRLNLCTVVQTSIIISVKDDFYELQMSVLNFVNNSELKLSTPKC